MTRLQSIIHDALYEEGTRVIQHYNPCQIQKLADGTMTCRTFPKGNRSNQLCCAGCEHHGPEGCTVKALGCKLMMCFQGTSITRNMELGFPKDMLIRLDELQRVGRAVGLPVDGCRVVAK